MENKGTLLKIKTFVSPSHFDKFSDRFFQLEFSQPVTNCDQPHSFPNNASYLENPDNWL